MGDVINNPPPAAGVTLVARLENLVDKILVLRITTVIGSVTNGSITDGPNGLEAAFTLAPLELACTTVNMALGNVTAVRTQKFADNPDYAKLHEDSLALGRAVRAETMELVMKAVQAVEAMAKL